MIAPFADFWNVSASDLRVSFDRYIVGIPRQLNDKTVKENPHLDQGGTLRGLQGLQGLVYLTDSGEHDGGLKVWDKSHLLHEEFLRAFPKYEKEGWIRLNEDELISWYNKRCKTVATACRAGDLLVLNRDLFTRVCILSRAKLK